MSYTFSTIFMVLAILQCCVGPPVTKNKEQHNETEDDGLEQVMEYHRYLREVVSALESDPDFKQKLEKASEDDIKSGNIAHELEFVSHHVRTRLDEIKRTELERLKELHQRKRELENNSIDDPTHHHLDKDNPHTFEIEDLLKLIAKTTADLSEADRKRKEEFKKYEMQKEFEKQQKLNATNGVDREKLEQQLKEVEEKHKKHEKLHEPGHKQQLEEVWEEQDHMQQEFDPKTFFMMHDLDGNGLWDENEVKALFVKELDKMYAQGAPEDDMRERVEEMERMRESVFGEVDTNRDGFIDFEEFLAQTKRNDFQQDHGWQGLDEQKVYTDEELNAYIQQHQAQAAYHQPPPGYHPGAHPQGYHPNQVPQGYPPQGHPQQGQFHPGQLQHVQAKPQHINAQALPPNYQGHVPDLNTNEVYQHQQQQMNHQQMQQQQINQQQMHQQQINQQQMHQQQINQQGNQVPQYQHIPPPQMQQQGNQQPQYQQGNQQQQINQPPQYQQGNQQQQMNHQPQYQQGQQQQQVNQQPQVNQQVNQQQQVPQSQVPQQQVNQQQINQQQLNQQQVPQQQQIPQQQVPKQNIQQQQPVQGNVQQGQNIPNQGVPQVQKL